MIVYRVDRHSKYVPNQIINLTKTVKTENIFEIYNNSFSEHGFTYLNDYSDSAVWELCLEFIRLNYFPQFPSRLQCIFGSKKLDDAIRWKNYFVNQFEQSGISNPQIPIFKIECDTCYEFDANWITNPQSALNTDCQFNIPSIAIMLKISYNYWSQEKTDNPFPEILIPLPAKVVDLI